MKIKRLVIENFKSIERIELIEPNPFTVFVGPNGSGKSNIFEALEFHIPEKDISEKFRLFGGSNYLQNRLVNSEKNYTFVIEADTFAKKERNGSYVAVEEIDTAPGIYDLHLVLDSQKEESNRQNYSIFAKSFSRIFVGKDNLLRQKFIDDILLNASANNLEKVLGRLLKEENLKEDFFEWLTLFVPEFVRAEIKTDSITGTDTLLIYEKSLDYPFTKNLISDGTYNILALLTAVYQSDKPQFLCIEEPENGLHPQVITSLVDFFRQLCQEKGHCIWLNTHSESLVRHLTTDEIILVNKRNGATQTRQIKGRNIYNLPTDQAWLTGALGGGLPW